MEKASESSDLAMSKHQAKEEVKDLAAEGSLVTGSAGQFGPHGDASSSSSSFTERGNPCLDLLQQLSSNIDGYLKVDVAPILQQSYGFEVEGVPSILQNLSDKVAEKKEDLLREKQVYKEKMMALASII